MRSFLNSRLIVIRTIGVCCVVFCAMFAMVWSVTNAYAEGDLITDSVIQKKATWHVLQSCFNDGVSLKSEIVHKDNSVYSSAFYDGGGIFNDKNTYYSPSGFLSDGPDGNKLKCGTKSDDLTSGKKTVLYYLVNQVGVSNADVKKIDTQNWAANEPLAKFYTGMTFRGESDDDSNSTIAGSSKFYIEWSNNGPTQKTNTLTIGLNETGEVVTISNDNSTLTDQRIQLLYGDECFGTAGLNGICVGFFQKAGEDYLNLQCSNYALYNSQYGQSPFSEQMNYINNALNAFKSILVSPASNCPLQDQNNTDGKKTPFNNALKMNVVNVSNEQNSQIDIEIYDKFTLMPTSELATVAEGQRARVAHAYLDGNSLYRDTIEPWSSTELFYIYSAYLKNNGVTVGYNDCGVEHSSHIGYIPVVRRSEDGNKYVDYCIVASGINDDGGAERELKLSVLGDNNEFGKEQKIGVRSVMQKLRDVEVSTLDLDRLLADYFSAASEGPTDPEDYGGESVDDAKCYDGSGPLGWILCPIIKAVSRIGEKLWEYIENTFLVIPVEVFETDGGVYQAWDTIRNIANVIFIILFLVVIFSQLTGVGIDNYGIKKILPRLIMVAILVNLSWIICELLADVSNITGSGITDMLKTFASQVATSSKSENAQLLVGSFGATVFGGGAGALFVLLNGWNLAGLAALGLAVLGIVITLVLGILTMFVILIVREAGVILMIVLAPVAIVCYALPNTEKLSKKWFDIFKALLVVYPLCGAALGAGKLASAVLASIGGSETAGVLAAINGGDFAVLGNTVFAALTNNGRAGLVIAAMVAQVLPFFFIPTLLRNSLSLMGNIGARLSQAGRNLGRKASGTLQSGVKNSERFKRFQQFEQDKTSARRARRIMNRFAGRNVNSLSRRQRNLLASANQTAARYELQGEKDRMLADNEMGYETELSQGTAAFANEREKKYMEIFGRETDRGEIEKIAREASRGKDAEKFTAAMKELVARGGEKEAMQIMEQADWNEMERNGISVRAIQTMGSMDIDSFRAYSKYRGKGGKGSYKAWYNGTNADSDIDSKEGTYAKHLSSLQSFDHLKKDELQFFLDNEERAKNLEAGIGSDKFNSYLAQVGQNSNDARVKTIVESELTSRIENGQADVDTMGLTTESFGTMRNEFGAAILEGYKKRIENEARVRGETMTDEQLTAAATEMIRNKMADKIAAAKADPRVMNKVSDGNRKIFGLEYGPSELSVPHEAGGGVIRDSSGRVIRRRG